ncbi:MAG: putative dsRNA-binding protein [Anaerolineales bacterium]|nr:putative dsRNA-binding protein [Anaerolineales bacterium]
MREFIHPILSPAAESIIVNRTDHDPKSQLQEWAQSQGFPAPAYRTIDSDGPDHAKTFMVEVSIDGQSYGHGSGTSKQLATKAAAQDALYKLGLGD